MLRDMLVDVFAELDRRIEMRWRVGDLQHGFWHTGMVPALMPVDTLREHGFWHARAENGLGRIGVSLQGGHTRVGIFLPRHLLDGMTGQGVTIEDAVARALDGQSAEIVRRLGGNMLFDRIYTAAPFSADWLRACVKDAIAREVLVNHLAWLVLTLWESAWRTIFSRWGDDKCMLLADAPLPDVIVEALPITLLDSQVYRSEDSGRDVWLTVLRLGGDLTEQDALERLQRLLPDARIRPWSLEGA